MLGSRLCCWEELPPVNTDSFACLSKQHGFFSVPSKVIASQACLILRLDPPFPSFNFSASRMPASIPSALCPASVSPSLCPSWPFLPDFHFLFLPVIGCHFLGNWANINSLPPPKGRRSCVFFHLSESRHT